MTTYRIDTGDGEEISCGMTEDQAFEHAQYLADEQRRSLYVSEDVVGSESVAVSPSAAVLGTMHILGREGGDACGQSECSPGCQEPSHQVRTVSLRITHADDREPIVDGVACLRRDLINGGWTPMGDSIDCWLSQEVIDYGNATGTMRQIAEEAQDWRVHTVALELRE